MSQPEEIQQPDQVAGAPDFLVEDLDQFVAILTSWHTDKCAVVQHLLTVPEGSSFEIGGEKLVMTADVLRGFKLGVEMAMMQLGTLPFVAEMEAEEAPTGG
jgi:hypothetical protein